MVKDFAGLSIVAGPDVKYFSKKRVTFWHPDRLIWIILSGRSETGLNSC